jgi:hypothetical protein
VTKKLEPEARKARVHRDLGMGYFQIAERGENKDGTGIWRAWEAGGAILGD